MTIALVVLSMLCAVSVLFTFLNLAASGRIVQSQVIFERVLTHEMDRLATQMAEMIDETEQALDCLVAADARLGELRLNSSVSGGCAKA